VKLPMLGAVESLNVSVATGVILYEALRQRASR
jgi:tRNA G18 (ribose-2'-O)-methylase SpoU